MLAFSFSDLYAPLLEALKAAVKWVLETVISLGASLHENLRTGNIIPGGPMMIEWGYLAWMSLMYWIEVANAWVPIREGFALLGAYYSFVFALVAVRYIRKLIPFLGG